MDNEYLTVKDVAVKLKVKPVTVYKWLREGKLQGSYFKIGGVYRFSEDKLIEILEQNFHQNDTVNIYTRSDKL